METGKKVFRKVTANMSQFLLVENTKVIGIMDLNAGRESKDMKTNHSTKVIFKMELNMVKEDLHTLIRQFIKVNLRIT